MNKPAAGPLFNYRKRQRQAILSDPQQISTEGSNSCASSEFAGQQSSYNTVKNQSEVVRTHQPVTIPKMKPGLMNIHGKFMNTNPPTPPVNKNVGNQNKFGNNNVNNNRSQPVHYNVNKPPANNVASCSNFQKALNAAAATSTFPYQVQSKAPFDIQGNRQTYSSFNNNLERRNLNLTERSFSEHERAAERNVQANSTNRGSSKKIVTACQKKQLAVPQNQRSSNQVSSQSYNFEDDDSCLLGAGVKTAKTQTQKSYNKNLTQSDQIDRSMHIFTCAISVMKSWPPSKKNDCQVMFEVFGVVDSAVVKDRTGTGKEFLLRDDTSSIKCVFYEIDRELPRLIRGQVHRVMGMFKSNREVLQVVSVRAAEKEERQVCQIACELSQREMEPLAMSQREP
ncbi:unnamed protein product [Lymnaea stagnalis]|uniref:Spermatogenesis-associated protein 22 n=1 Tax=Lymnaea stagnalis TaxID=6523 RepID=A0AAV2IGA3_LYMST